MINFYRNKVSTALPILLISLPIISYAKPMICPFTDSFNINSPVPTYINLGHVEGNLKFTKIDDKNFTLGCAKNSQRTSGDLFVNIGIDKERWCTLTIHDGPFEMNPTVTQVSCSINGFAYKGIEHRLGSYEYKLNFTV